jgi:hypothetical protein
MQIHSNYLRSVGRKLSLGTASLLLFVGASHGETIGNLSYWSTQGLRDGNGGTQLAIGAWNGPTAPKIYNVPAPTVGEVITAPTDGNTVLRSFTVAMPGSVPGFQMNLTAAVFAWNAASFRPTGQALGSVPLSNAQTTGTESYLSNFYDLTFDLGARLAPGQQYVVLFSTLGLEQPVFYEGSSFGVTSNDSYTGGQMVFASAGTLHESSTPLSALQTERWGKTGSCDELQLSTLCLSAAQGYFPYPGIVAPDLAFAADFEPPNAAAVPEPSSLYLLGVACVACRLRRVRRS